MNKFALTGALFLLIEVSATSALHAARAKNRPWFSGKEKAKPTVQVVRKKAPQRLSAVSVARHATKPHKTNDPGLKIVEQAMSYKGTKYRFGGTSKSQGFDCSGLVARVWADLQLKKVPRHSSQLYKAGMPVRLADLREGDLVFFKNTYKRGISHVGVYAGKNKFIHAPNSHKRVSITRLSDPYYQIHYAGARRLY